MKSKGCITPVIICIFQMVAVFGNDSSTNTGSYNTKKSNMTCISGNNQTGDPISTVSDSLRVKTGNELVILVHGFAKTNRDMSSLKKFFRSRGYHVSAPALPATFGSLEECTFGLDTQ